MFPNLNQISDSFTYEFMFYLDKSLKCFDIKLAKNLVIMIISFWLNNNNYTYKKKNHNSY